MSRLLSLSFNNSTTHELAPEILRGFQAMYKICMKPRLAEGGLCISILYTSAGSRYYEFLA